jgi:uncharacterized hydrophobic protein (TIGR00271 family)
MVHLRLVVPADRTERALEALCSTPSVCNVVLLEGVARRPHGDVILCDVAREDASVVIDDLKRLRIHRDGSIALETIDSQLSEFARMAEKHAPGAPADSVVWEEVEERTNENVELSAVFLLFMVIAALIAAVGIFLNSPILIVGAMVVGPEFGPIAGFCVALVQRQRDLAIRSFKALALGFPLAIAATFVATLIFKRVGLIPDSFSSQDHELARVIASPDFFAAFVAVCAGTAGMLSLSTAKSGALIGVVISITTIPAAASIGVSAAYADWAGWRGSVGQLAINMAAILVSGTVVLGVQRGLYHRRLAKHERHEASEGVSVPDEREPAAAQR